MIKDVIIGRAISHTVEMITQYRSNCKYCDHVADGHIYSGECVIVYKDESGSLQICKCKNYKPSNNLEYLELMSDKRK